MEQESKALSELGLFGLIGLCVLVFCSLSFCLCFVIHVRFIWTVICPLLSILKCCSSCLNKFRIKHKAKPQNFSDVEERILRSKSAQKSWKKDQSEYSFERFSQYQPQIERFYQRHRSPGQTRVLQEELWTSFSPGPKKTDFWTCSDAFCGNP